MAAIQVTAWARPRPAAIPTHELPTTLTTCAKMRSRSRSWRWEMVSAVSEMEAMCWVSSHKGLEVQSTFSRLSPPGDLALSAGNLAHGLFDVSIQVLLRQAQRRLRLLQSRCEKGAFQQRDHESHERFRVHQTIDLRRLLTLLDDLLEQRDPRSESLLCLMVESRIAVVGIDRRV